VAGNYLIFIEHAYILSGDLPCDLPLITGILILVGSLFGWASGAGERRGLHIKDTERIISSQENKSLFNNEKQNHFHQNNDTNSLETKTLNGDQQVQYYESEKYNTEVSEMENPRKVTQSETRSLV
jgi:hypothetical protein